MTATVGLTAKHRFDYRPHDATVTVQSVSPEGLTAAVTALHGSAVVDLTPDKALTTTVTLAFTASRHTSTDTITVTSYCAAGFRASPDGTCQALSQELDDACIQDIPAENAWGSRIRTSSVDAVLRRGMRFVNRQLASRFLLRMGAAKLG